MRSSFFPSCIRFVTLRRLRLGLAHVTEYNFVATLLSLRSHYTTFIYYTTRRLWLLVYLKRELEIIIHKTQTLNIETIWVHLI